MTFKKHHLSEGLMARWMNKCFGGTPETARETRAPHLSSYQSDRRTENEMRPFHALCTFRACRPAPAGHNSVAIWQSLCWIKQLAVD
jgi:hypothetical protein